MSIKRIKISEKILGIILENSMSVNGNDMLARMKAYRITQLIQNNYRRRVYKKKGK